jgi:tRNA(Ser,Leu) C12 N-acetylase TAN1
MADINLLVTFDPVHEQSAKAEIEEIAKEAKEKVKIGKVEEGLAEISAGDARKFIKKILDMAKKDIDKFKYTFNWWPVDKWCKSGVSDMQKVIAELEKDIKKEEKWKLEFSRRKTDKDYGKDIIIKLTEVVDKPKVDLKKPDKIIKVEVIADKAAISVFAKDETLNLAKLRK